MEGQDKIHNAKVLSVGAGGLGSPVILYLAAAWIGTIGIIDGDVVDLSNLQRQVNHFTNIQAAEVLKYFTGAGELLTDKLFGIQCRTIYFVISYIFLPTQNLLKSKHTISIPIIVFRHIGIYVFFIEKLHNMKA